MTEESPSYTDEAKTKRVSYLLGLKKRTAQQQMLVDLYGQTTRTAKEEKALAVLFKAERVAEAAAKLVTARKEAAAAESRKVAEAERKARNHRLIKAGLLIEWAGLADADRAMVLGALLAVSKANDPQRAEAWRSAGAALLATKDET